MEKRMGKDKIQLLSQALNAASSSLNLAKQFLTEIEHGGGTGETPGLVGKYDGMFMVTEAGKKYPVPDNYAAKTKLLYGDKLKMIEGPEGRRFKLLEEVERAEEGAQLALKDGRFEALGKDASFKLLQGAVRFWNGEEGDKLKILLPKGGKNVPFACLLEIVGRQPGGAPEGSPTSDRASEKQLTEPKKEPEKKVEVEVVRKEEKKPEKEEEKPEKKEPPRKEREEKSSTAKKEVPKEVSKEEKKALDNRAPAKLLGSRSESSKKASKPLDEEELR